MVTATDVLEMVRTVCSTCHGTGEDAHISPSCLYCGAQWEPVRFDAWIEAHDRVGTDPIRWRRWTLPSWLALPIRCVLFASPRARNAYRWLALPCGHDLALCLHYVADDCLDCRGVGTVASLQLSQRYQQRQRALLTAQHRPQANRAVPTPIRPITPRLATAPVSAYYAIMRRR